MASRRRGRSRAGPPPSRRGGWLPNRATRRRAGRPNRGGGSGAVRGRGSGGRAATGSSRRRIAPRAPSARKKPTWTRASIAKRTPRPPAAPTTQQPARERHEERDDERRSEQGEPTVACGLEGLRLRMGVRKQDLVGDDVAAEEAGDRPADRDEEPRRAPARHPSSECVERSRSSSSVSVSGSGRGRAMTVPSASVSVRLGASVGDPVGIGLVRVVLESLDVLGRDRESARGTARGASRRSRWTTP